MTKYLVTGGNGFLGKAVVSKLTAEGHSVFVASRQTGFDLTFRQECFKAFTQANPDRVIHLAAMVGGIGLNQKQPADLWLANLEMGLNILRCSLDRVDKLVMVGTTCSYPKSPKTVPFVESELFGGYPEPTNAAYGIAKLCLIEGMRAYRKQYNLNAITLIPTNLYGPGDNDNPNTSHVIAAIMRKVKMAILEGRDTVELWGTGKATRDFLYIDDAAEAIIRADANYDDETPVNIGSGQEVSIAAIAGIIKHVAGWKGKFVYDSSKPDGQPRRVLDTTLAFAEFNWKATTQLRDGLEKTWASLK